MSLNCQKPPILIVGAGPAGLVLALSLLQNGVPVRIIEKDLEYHAGQRGAGVMPRTLEMYHFLGVLPDVFAQSADPLPMQSYEIPGGRVPLKTWRMSAVEDPTSDIPWPNATMLGQDTAEAILRRHLQQHGCEVELGARLVSFVDTGDNVEACLAKLKVGGEQEVIENARFKWLIGADGARSIVRKTLGMDFLGTSRTERHIIADVHIDGLDMHHLHVFGGGESGLILIWPNERKDGNLMTVYATGPDADYDAMAADYNAFTNMYAAHVHSLTGAQGLNTSVQDSFNLAWKLALVERGLASQALLSTHTEERLPVVAEVLNITTGLYNKYLSQTRESSGWQRGGKLSQLHVNYRWSSILVDNRCSADSATAKHPYGENDNHSALEGLATLRAGDRAPDATGLYAPDSGEETRTFDILGTSKHTILLFSTVPDTVAEASKTLDAYPMGLFCIVIITPSKSQFTLAPGEDLRLFNDTQGHAHKSYWVPDGVTTIVVIRPDGMVGAIVLDVEGLKKYQLRIFLAGF
ncbi:hypothetical protein HGRIS_003565 [Hohenbuehelia grisea]|uniref:FAD-binding domain-containing protein n=1 Tax=Hohenbuehelia grisea TaxID=104357 RepID=A0ABR3JFU9_9AGAR